MSDPRRFRLADLIPFLLVLATAAGARVGYLVTYADNAASEGPWLVQEAPPDLALPADTGMGRPRVNEVEALAANVRDHRWFGSLAPFAPKEERTAHAAPGYPWLVGEIERYLPGELTADHGFIRWLQCGLGVLTAGLYYLVARRAFSGRLVAVLAGLLCALHPFWVINTPAINDGVLATFLLAACLFLAIRGSQVEGALTSLFLGLALAALALVRAALLPFAVIVLLWYLRRVRQASGGWQVALVAVLGFVIGLTPWMLRNAQVFGDIYPVVNSTYYHLWVGNNPQATGGPLPEKQLRDMLIQGIKLETPLTVEKLEEQTQGARYREFGLAAVEEIQKHPEQTLERRLWAGLYFLFGEDWFSSKRLWRLADPNSSIGTEGPPYPALLVGSLLLLLLFGALGWRWSYARRMEAGPLALAIFWVPLPYFLSHAGGLSGPRLPLDGVLCCYTALVLAALVRRPMRKPLLRELGGD